MKKTSAALLLMANLMHTSSFAEDKSLEANKVSPKEIVGQYFSSLESGDFATLMDLLDEDIIWHQPGNSILSGTYRGKKAVGDLFGRFMEISQGSFKIDEVSAIMENGNLVSATLRFSARRCGYVDVHIEMSGVDLMRVENGKIKEVFLFSADQKAEDDFWTVAS